MRFRNATGPRRRSLRAFVTVTLACALAAACSGDGSNGDAADDPVGDDPASDGPLYVISASVSTGSDRAAFGILVDSLDAGADADIGNSIEISNAGLFAGPPQSEVMYEIDGATPQLTEFRLGSDGSFERGRTVSFLDFSVTTMRANGGNFIFFSETKAYVIDTFTQTIIQWDPSEMAITGTIDLSEIGLPGEVGLVGDLPLQRGDELVISIHYLGLGSDGRTGFGPESALLFLDPATDTVSRVVTIENCGTVGNMFLDDQGDLYAASEFDGITTRLAGDRGGPECVFRVPAGTYDVEDYTLLTDRADGMFAGSMFQSEDTTVYFRVLDTSLLPDDALTTGEISGAQAWFWGSLNLADDEPIRILTDLGANAGSTRGYQIDGATWITESDEGFSGTTLIDISGGGFRRGVSVPGVVRNVFRVR
ncbi:MAG: hypothetical protein AAGF92_01835 [Myxococcota bacterium]